LSFEDDLTTYHKDGNTHSIQTPVLFIRIDIQNRAPGEIYSDQIFCPLAKMAAVYG